MEVQAEGEEERLTSTFNVIILGGYVQLMRMKG